MRANENSVLDLIQADVLRRISLVDFVNKRSQSYLWESDKNENCWSKYTRQKARKNVRTVEIDTNFKISLAKFHEKRFTGKVQPFGYDRKMGDLLRHVDMLDAIKLFVEIRSRYGCLFLIVSIPELGDFEMSEIPSLCTRMLKATLIQLTIMVWGYVLIAIAEEVLYALQCEEEATQGKKHRFHKAYSISFYGHMNPLLDSKIPKECKKSSETEKEKSLKDVLEEIIISYKNHGPGQQQKSSNVELHESSQAASHATHNSQYHTGETFISKLPVLQENTLFGGFSASLVLLQDTALNEKQIGMGLFSHFFELRQPRLHSEPLPPPQHSEPEDPKALMRQKNFRIASMIHLFSMAKAVELSEAGIYLDEDADEFRCCCCSLVMARAQWPKDASPKEVHQKLSPDCPLFKRPAPAISEHSQEREDVERVQSSLEKVDAKEVLKPEYSNERSKTNPLSNKKETSQYDNVSYRSTASVFPTDVSNNIAGLQTSTTKDVNQKLVTLSTDVVEDGEEVPLTYKYSDILYVASGNYSGDSITSSL